jgi:hypothetical protein
MYLIPLQLSNAKGDNCKAALNPAVSLQLSVLSSDPGKLCHTGLTVSVTRKFLEQLVLQPLLATMRTLRVKNPQAVDLTFTDEVFVAPWIIALPVICQLYEAWLAITL